MSEIPDFSPSTPEPQTLGTCKLKFRSPGEYHDTSHPRTSGCINWLPLPEPQTERHAYEGNWPYERCKVCGHQPGIAGDDWHLAAEPQTENEGRAPDESRAVGSSAHANGEVDAGTVPEPATSAPQTEGPTPLKGATVRVAWEKAVVKIRVPVEGTLTSAWEETEIPMSVLFPTDEEFRAAVKRMTP